MEKVPFLRGTPAQIFNFFQILRKVQAMRNRYEEKFKPWEIDMKVAQFPRLVGLTEMDQIDYYFDKPIDTET